MSLRNYLFYSQRGKCHYCNIHMDRKPKGKFFCTEDHIIPRSMGGSDLIGNLVGACLTCNNMRGSIPYEEFKTFIQLHGNRVPIKEVLKSLTPEQYLLYKVVYDAVRWHHYQSHLAFSQKDMMPPLHARRPYINEARRRIKRREDKMKWMMTS